MEKICSERKGTGLYNIPQSVQGGKQRTFRQEGEKCVWKPTGLVIREQNIGESDRLITLLTRQKESSEPLSVEQGVLRAPMRGQLSFLLFSISYLYGKRKNVIDEAEPINVFFDLRKSVEALDFRTVFCRTQRCFGSEEDEAEEILRTVLNALYLLCKGTKPQKQIKAVTELRLLCAAGYMPDLICCEKCGAFETPTMYFDCRKPVLYCQNCGYGLGKV